MRSFYPILLQVAWRAGEPRQVLLRNEATAVARHNKRHNNERLNFSILLVGCGKMGGALLRGWLAEGLDGAKVVVVQPSRSGAEEFATQGAQWSPARQIWTRGLSQILLSWRCSQSSGRILRRPQRSFVNPEGKDYLHRCGSCGFTAWRVLSAGRSNRAGNAKPAR